MSLVQPLEKALQNVTLITGHYGVGKTNLALNIAFDAILSGYQVKLVDLDVVNPYFRSSEYATLLTKRGVDLIAPVLANTSVDVPSLSAGVYGAIEWAQLDNKHLLVIDVGGDDVGATALGRFAPTIQAQSYAFFYVVNRYRNLTQSSQEALHILHEIENKSGLQASGVINNSHLKELTTKQEIETSEAFGIEVASQAHLPLVVQTVPNKLFDGTQQGMNLTRFGSKAYPVNIFVKTPWE